MSTSDMRGATVDEKIEELSHRRLGDVVRVSENNVGRIGPDSRSAANAAEYLVARLYTDAIFSCDIRAIQLIVDRIDGGLPKDVEIGLYRTQFSDCLNEILAMRVDDRMVPLPDDTVMMALGKALYAVAVQDIYLDRRTGGRRERARTDLKQERDVALRMILERTGGRRTLTSVSQVHEEIEDADWINALPGV